MPDRKPYQFHPEAWLELAAADDWYRERSPETHLRFLSAIVEGLDTVAIWPSSWPAYRHGTRRFILPNFPFSIIYFDAGERIAVVAVAHHKRKPGYWKDRVGG